MPIKAPKKDIEFELAPPGNHVARLYQITNLGIIPTTYNGEEKRTARIRLSFELCDEMKRFEVEENGQKKEVTKPFSVSKEYTLSMSPKSNMRPVVEGIVGKMTDEAAYAFEIDSLIGRECLLNVVHQKSADGTKEFAAIASAGPLPKGMAAPTMFNEGKILDVMTMTLEEIDALPDYIKLKMKSSTEFYERFQKDEDSEPEETINPDDIPFN